MYPQYMYILLYRKLIQCNVIPHIYGQLEWEQVFPKYMCILLYVKLIWCNGFHEFYCQLEQGIDVSAVYVHSAICKTYAV